MLSSGIAGNRRIFLYRGRCDMRRSFDRLAAMVQQELEENPLHGDLFLFLNRNQTRLKCLYWDQDGYVLWYKRLERGKFVRPGQVGAEIDMLQLNHLLAGIQVQMIRSQPRYKQV